MYALLHQLIKRWPALLPAIFVFTKTHAQSEVVTFPSKDGVLITADVYHAANKFPYILLCHQAGYSRGEYAETALKLNKLGYNCMAIDQRSGFAANDVQNQTYNKAMEKGAKISYEESRQDIEAAVDWLEANRTKRRIYAIGSSYSASLLLCIANKSPEKFKAIILFSPGEYFENPNYIRNQVKEINLPVMVLSTKSEAPYLKEFLPVSNNLKFFSPLKGEGKHGSSALWKTTKENQDYWIALIFYLDNVLRLVF
jgi:dienelactone hydrolase